MSDVGNDFEMPNEDDNEELIEESPAEEGGALPDGDGEPVPNPPHNSGH